MWQEKVCISSKKLGFSSKNTSLQASKRDAWTGNDLRVLQRSEKEVVSDMKEIPVWYGQILLMEV
ncbi:MAG: hypothetical protein VX725_02415, partial [Actinomycetota bacterium]|nr:hypothetical protein [Actinomycetota bacterium]